MSNTNYYIVYLEPISKNETLSPDIAEKNFETYRNLNNFSEIYKSAGI